MAQPDAVWIYGRHAVAAALANPARKLRRLLLTVNSKSQIETGGHLAEIVKPAAIDAVLPPGAVHQGAAALFAPLPPVDLEEVCADPDPGRPVVILDQITDPQNIGAIIRSAAAFGARAVISQDRRTPPLAGALAKAAAGGLESVPIVQATNIARAIDALKAAGYLVIGLAGRAAAPLDSAPRKTPVALALGGEGAGLRRLTREKCDLLLRIPITDQIDSLNVSNAAAIALYELTKRN